jgi:hypothetical protein
VALAALGACGGGGGAGGGSAAPDQGDDVARLQPGNRPVRFRLDGAVTPADQAFIVETLAWAHTDLGDSGPLTIHVYSDEEHFVVAYTNDFGIDPVEARRQLAEGQTAFESPGGHIWIYLPNYLDAPEGERRHALFHEYDHTLQEWQAEVRFQSTVASERSFVPRWLVEGCAEYIAVQAGAARGFVDAARERAFVVAEVRRTTEPLTDFESGGQAEFLGGSGAAYTAGWLGCERLAAHGTDDVTHRFWLAMAKARDWTVAFTDTFGRSPAAFYTDFERYRATL